MKRRLVVYTAIFGGKDVLNEPKKPSPRLDYIAFTDDPTLYSNTWQIVQLPPLAGIDPRMRSRFYKILPHFALPQYTYSLWVDGNMELLEDTAELFDKYAHHEWVCVPIDYRNMAGKQDIYDEARHCLHLKKGDSEKIEKYVERCRKEGHPERFGLWQNGVILRDQLSYEAYYLCQAWWSEYVLGCPRDQLSFPHAVFKCGFPRPQTFTEADLERHFARYGHRI